MTHLKTAQPVKAGRTLRKWVFTCLLNQDRIVVEAFDRSEARSLVKKSLKRSLPPNSEFFLHEVVK